MRTRRATRPARSSRRRFAAAILAPLLLAALTTACGDDGGGSGTAEGPTSAGESSTLRPFTVVLDWTPNTNHSGLYLAASKGLYRKAGLDVKIVEPGDAGGLQLLASGKADVAVTAVEEVVPARAQGLPVQSVAGIIQHNTSSLISLKSDGITRPKGLEGRTYAGYGGPLEKALLDALVSCDGGDPAKVKTVDIGEADYRVGLERNQFDTVWVFDGWDKIRLAEIDDLDVATIPFIDHTDCIPDWYTPVLASSTKVEQKRAADLKAFLAATAEGYRLAMSNPQAAADVLLKAAPDLDRELVELSARYLSTRYTDDPKAWGRQDAKVWDRFVEFLRTAGLVEDPVEAGDVWTNDFLPANP